MGFQGHDPSLLPSFCVPSSLSGHGIEIGALHNPVAVPDGARVTYVDRMTVDQLRAHYPELADRPFVPVDIVTDGERLDGIGDDSQDFVIANHVLEHLEDPIRALINMCRVLRPGGVICLAVPDKHTSFDAGRLTTTFAHVWRDFREGPETSRRHHYEEWTRIVNKVVNEAEARRQIDDNVAAQYSIHFHAWTEIAFREFLDATGLLLNCDVEQFARHGDEFTVVIRRNAGALLRQPIEHFMPAETNDFAAMLDEMLRPEPWAIERVVVTGDGIEISGWALAPRGQHARVGFTVNGRLFRDVEYPLARPDIARMFWYKDGADRTGFRCRMTIPRAELFANGPPVFQFVERALGKPIREEHAYYYSADPGEATLEEFTTAVKINRTLRDVLGEERRAFRFERAPRQGHAAWIDAIFHDTAPGGVVLIQTSGIAAACREPWTLEDWREFQSSGVRTTGDRTFLSESYVRRQWSELFEILTVVPAYIDNRDDVVVMRRDQEPST